MTAIVRNIKGQKRRSGASPAGLRPCLDDASLLDSDIDDLDQEQTLKLIDALASEPLREERQ